MHLLENEHCYTVRIEHSTISNSLVKSNSTAKPTLKRQNTDDDDDDVGDDKISSKKQKHLVNQKEQPTNKDLSDSQNLEDSAEDNRLNWIQSQLDALHANANKW